MTRPFIVIGAGGHAAVVADALLVAGHVVIGYTDADTERRGTGGCGLPILGGDDVLDRHDPAAVWLVNGLGGTGRTGDSAKRRALQQRLQAAGWQFAAVRHPSAVVSPHAKLGAWTQLLAGCIVQTGACIGDGCIVNTGAIVEHDASVDAWSHVAPRALLCGHAAVGTGCHIGAGAVVRQGVRIAAESTVGAGAVVVTDVPRAAVLMGVPARPTEKQP
jgi:sugar O-acyltransferase (sialic acid O-acetyltransferase NeuD family)